MVPGICCFLSPANTLLGVRSGKTSLEYHTGPVQVAQAKKSITAQLQGLRLWQFLLRDVCLFYSCSWVGSLHCQPGAPSHMQRRPSPVACGGSPQRTKVTQDTELVTQVPANPPDKPSVDSRELQLDKRNCTVIYRRKKKKKHSSKSKGRQYV